MGIALLLLARLLSVCRAQDVGREHEHEELQEMLRSALEHGVDIAPMVPQLRELAKQVPGQRGRALQRQLGAPRQSLGNAGVAGAVLQIMEAVPIGSLSAASITKLAAACGLPLDEDERVDQRLEAARARGSMFFEDVDGLAPNEADLEVAEAEIPNKAKEGGKGKQGKKRRKNRIAELEELAKVDKQDEMGDAEELPNAKRLGKKRRHK